MKSQWNHNKIITKLQQNHNKLQWNHNEITKWSYKEICTGVKIALFRDRNWNVLGVKSSKIKKRYHYSSIGYFLFIQKSLYRNVYHVTNIYVGDEQNKYSNNSISI